MAASDVVIVGVGAVTPVGLSADETAASVQSGVMRFAGSAVLDARFEPITLAEVLVDGLPELSPATGGDVLTARERRLLRLAEGPLLECLAALPVDETSPPLVLALPEMEPAAPIDGAAFLARLAVRVPGFSAEASDAGCRGRAGGVQAIGQAADRIRSGQAPFVVAGAVDTYRDPYVLATLEVERRLKNDANPDGFIPGEGAAFVLLASAPAAAAHGVTPLANVSVVTAGFEPGHVYADEPYKGAGLSEAIAAQIAAGTVREPIREVYSSMNGEGYWAKEWGVVQVKHRPAFADEVVVHHPADCYGDAGAAVGPLAVALASLAMKNGGGLGPVLVYGSSDRGERAAVTLTRN